MEGCLYGVVERIFGDLATAANASNESIQMECIPQGPFFEREQRPGPFDRKSLEESMPSKELGKRTPDFLSLLTATNDEGEYVDSELAYWVEVKCMDDGWTVTEDNDQRFEKRFAAAIPQVNEQAAYAFQTIKKGDRFYAFIIVASRFSLLRYSRPIPSAGASDRSSSDSNIMSERVVMPDSPEVVYWSQAFLDAARPSFTEVFLDAVDQLLTHLGLTLQASWFVLEKNKEGRHPFSAQLRRKLEGARVRPRFDASELVTPLIILCTCPIEAWPRRR